MAITRSNVAAGASLLVILYGFWSIALALGESGSLGSKLTGGDQFKLVGIIVAGMLVNNFIAYIFQVYARANQWSIESAKVGQHAIMAVIFSIASKLSIVYIKNRLYS